MAETKPQAGETAPYQLDQQVGYLLRLVTQRHHAIFHSLMIEGLTPTQFSALVRLAEVGECSQNQLGRLALMDVATIKGVIDRLRRKELVRVDADPSDKRRALISLTDSGAALVADLHRLGHEITDQTLDPLDAGERRQLAELLRKLT